jgi:cob(I)alamin adenosyltransferase
MIEESKGLTRGLVQVYTGDGKGKTTAALGLAVRAVGQGLRVVMVQFIKGLPDCGEHLFAGKYGAFTILQPSIGNAWQKPRAQLRAEAQETFALAEKTLLGGMYDVVILDELVTSLRDGLVDEVQALALIELKPPGVELVLTGRGAPPSLVKAADLVTEMLAIKHPYDDGVPGRRGIEF